MSPISYKSKNMRRDEDKDHIENLAVNPVFSRGLRMIFIWSYVFGHPDSIHYKKKQVGSYMAEIAEFILDSHKSNL